MSSQHTDFNLYFFDNGRKSGFKRRLRKQDVKTVQHNYIDSLEKSSKANSVNNTPLPSPGIYDTWKNSSNSVLLFEEAKLYSLELLDDIATYFSIANIRKVVFLPKKGDPFLQDRESTKDRIIYLSEYILELLNFQYSVFVKSITYKARDWKDLKLEKSFHKGTDSGIFSVPHSAMSQTKPILSQKTKNEKLSAGTSLYTITSGVELKSDLERKNNIDSSVLNNSSYTHVESRCDSGMTSNLDRASIMSNKRELKNPIQLIKKGLDNYGGLNKQLNHEKGSVIMKSSQKINSKNSSQKINVKKIETRFEKIQSQSEEVIAPPITQHLISFSISSRTCHEKGWVVQESNIFGLEQQTLIAWAHARLLQAIKLQEGQEVAAKQTRRRQSMSTCYYSEKSGRKFQTTLSDNLLDKKVFSVADYSGSLILFYPSGQPAIITLPNTTLEGNFALAFSDFHGRLLACFTPAGCGACFYKSGHVQFLSSELYGLCQEETGNVIKEWSWNNLKLQPPLSLQLNSRINFKCSQKHSMIFCLSINGKTTKVRIGSNTKELGSTVNKQHSSSIVVQLSKSLPCQKRSGSVKEHKVTPHFQENMATDKEGSYPLNSKNPTIEDNSHLLVSKDATGNYSLHLKLIKKKFKSTISEWINYYRTATGMNSFLTSVKVNGIANNQSSLVELVSKTSCDKSCHQRTRSAPMTLSQHKKITSAEKDHPKYFMGNISKHPACDNSINNNVSSKHPFKCGFPQPIKQFLPKQGCPVALRAELMGAKQAYCRCDKRNVPHISDVEFDLFLGELPKTQLLVISLVHLGLVTILIAYCATQFRRPTQMKKLLFL